MAKKEKSKVFGLSDLSGVMENLSKKSVVTIENLREEKQFISTGIYILDAMISKSVLNGGISNRRMTVFAGPYATGKSYIAMSIARNAQKKGYNVIYIDTEYSIELSDFDMFGVKTDDDDTFMLIREGEVEKLKVFMATIIDELKTQNEKGIDVTKNIFIIDSLGQLASQKEKQDAKDGKDKTDMSRAKGVTSLMRIIINDLGYLGIPIVATNQVYQTMDFFPQTKQKGGESLNYTPSAIIYLSAAQLKEVGGDDLSLGQDGIIITAKAKKNRLAKPKKIKFEINHTFGVNPYKGLEFFCTPENFDKLGIAKVKQEVDKKTGEVTYKPGGNKWYVRHLDKSLFDKNLYNGKVFNQEVREALEPIVYDYFRYPTYEESIQLMENIEEQYDTLDEDFGDEFNLGDDDIDEKLF